MNKIMRLAILLSVLCSCHLGQSAVEFSFGLSARQGTRPAMEDEHVHEMKFDGNPNQVLFALFDGHGGREAAKIAKNSLASTLKSNVTKYKDIDKRFKQTFLDLDDLIIPRTKSGSTALVAYIKNNTVTIAWAGDSRALVIGELDEGDAEVKIETSDHKPMPKSKEYERLQKALGNNFKTYVAQKGKIWRLGGLAVSRSLGDSGYRKKLGSVNALIPDPEIQQSYLHDGYIIVLACDGVWDVLNSKDVVDIVQKGIQSTKGIQPTDRNQLIQKLTEAKFDENNDLGTEEVSEAGAGRDGERLKLIARALRNAAYNKKSKDNISVMLIEYHA